MDRNGSVRLLLYWTKPLTVSSHQLLNQQKTRWRNNNMGDESDMDFEHHISPFSSQYSLSKILINSTFRISGLSMCDNCCSCCVRETVVIPTGGVMSQFSNVYSRFGLDRILHPLALVLALDVDNFVTSQNDHKMTTTSPAYIQQL